MMARDKTDKTDTTPAATIATREGWNLSEPLWSTKRSPSEKFKFAVLLARAAIRCSKSRPPIRADTTSPQAKVAGYLARQENGETLTPTDLTDWSAALEQQSKRRGRGRPKGTRDIAALAAFRAAAFAIQFSGIKNRARQCDAIAEAMLAEGYKTRRTYQASVQEMKIVLHERRAFYAKVKAIKNELETWQNQFQAINHTVTESFSSFQNQMQKTTRSWRELQRCIHSLKIDPETLEKFSKRLK